MVVQDQLISIEDREKPINKFVQDYQRNKVFSNLSRKEIEEIRYEIEWIDFNFSEKSKKIKWMCQTIRDRIELHKFSNVNPPLSSAQKELYNNLEEFTSNMNFLWLGYFDLDNADKQNEILSKYINQAKQIWANKEELEGIINEFNKILLLLPSSKINQLRARLIDSIDKEYTVQRYNQLIENEIAGLDDELNSIEWNINLNKFLEQISHYGIEIYKKLI